MIEQFKGKYRKLGLKIAYFRKLKGHTQESLAEAIEINSTFLGQVECGARGISLDNVFKISQALEIPTYKLFDFDED